jgi:hypothetical protein
VDETTSVLAAVNRRGRPVLVTVTGSQLRDADAVTGVILLMEVREDTAREDTAREETADQDTAGQAV